MYHPEPSAFSLSVGIAEMLPWMYLKMAGGGPQSDVVVELTRDEESMTEFVSNAFCVGRMGTWILNRDRN
jgi:hypothetical protein